jgi:hypothetical protein
MISRAVFCLLALSVAAPAFAQPIEELPPRRDRDVEAAPPKEQVFISPSGEPFRAPLGDAYPSGTWFARADADQNRALSAEEFAADHAAFFEKMDADKDGVVDGFESNEYERAIAPEVAAQPSGRPRRGVWLFGRSEMPRKELRGAAHYGLIDDPLPNRSPDANFDYRVTREEWQAAATKRFKALDKDENGAVAWDELPTTRMQRDLERLK